MSRNSPYFGRGRTKSGSDAAKIVYNSAIRFLLPVSVLLLSAGVRADGSITNVAEISRAALEGVDEPRHFTLVATLTSQANTNDISFNVMDGTGFASILAWEPRDTPLVRGDRVCLSGFVKRNEDGLSYPTAGKVTLIAHGPAPEPIDASADDIYAGRLTYAPVRVSGIVADAFRDETDPNFTFLALRSGERTLYLPSVHMTDDDLARLIDATVSVVGYCSSYRGLGPRARIGYEVYYDGPSSIAVLRPAPADPFAVPELAGDVHAVWSPRTSGPLRRRTGGEVVAVWQETKLLVRTRGGDLSTVELARPPAPPCGSFIEAAGLPETDFYHLNLSRAVCREARPFTVSNPPPETVTAAYMMTDDRGRRKFRVGLHGRTVRLTGTVSALPGGGSRDGVLHLLSGDRLVSVDASAVPAALDRLAVGGTAEVTGVCVMETENWRPQAPFPHIVRASVVVRSADDIRVLARPPWWTPGRGLAVIGSLLVALVAILVWNRILRRLVERRGRQLFREQIARASSDLRIGERTRLAVELHDSLAQNLTGIALEVEAAKDYNGTVPEEMRGHLDFASRALRSCREELRNCMWDLRSSTLEEKDMGEAIRKALLPHVTGTDLRIRFHVPRAKFSDMTTQALVKAIRELTLNAIRHGGAATVRIAGELDEDGLMCSVRDDGAGFDPDDCPGLLQGHFGLQGVKERIEQLGGTFSIASRPGHGAKAIITLPPRAANSEKQT